MKPDRVPPPDSFHLKAAEGWLELGNAAEARAELNQIADSSKTHPHALELSWRIFAATHDWQQSVDVAAELARQAPDNALSWIHWAYSLHELKRTQEAWDILAPVADRFPDEFLIRYNLACYACQLGRREEARRWLKAAIKLVGVKPILNLAADDPDLKPIWNELGGLDK
jgi:tetratricopeptide (TPR) repeat protein